MLKVLFQEHGRGEQPREQMAPAAPQTLKVFCISSFPPGESGLGKSTLINSLFLTDLYSSEYPGPSHRIKKTVQVGSREEEQAPHHLQERLVGVLLVLRLERGQ